MGEKTLRGPFTDQDVQVIRETIEEDQAMMVEQPDGSMTLFAPPPTLRDRFAMSALTQAGEKNGGHTWDPETLASYCYAIADAMLAERAKGEG